MLMEDVMTRTAVRILSSFNLLAFLATLTVNGLANALPINGRATGEISDSLPNLFVPAGFTFAIWGLIYLMLGIWSFWQFVSAMTGREPGVGQIEKLGVLFLIASAANISWLLAWHYERFPLSLLFMFMLLASLIAMYQRLDIGRVNWSIRTTVAAHTPFSLYLGWISVATVANVTAVLVAAGWNGFGISEAAWAGAVIVAAALIAVLMVLQRHDSVFALVVLWAFFGIIMARIAGEYQSRDVAIVAAGSAGIVLAVLVRLWLVK
jgi:hypothetical protein